jgi:hypothetical protein
MQAVKMEDDSDRMFSQENRAKLAVLIMNLFEKWQLKNLHRLSLLGLSENSKPALYKYKKGESPLPVSRDTLDRVGMLLSIHKSLKMLYPNNPNICYSWVTMKNKMFDGKSPLDVMINEGFAGVMRVYWYLNNMRRM